MPQKHVDVADFTKIRLAAKSDKPVEGLTHCHYKYPARFSPEFVGATIEALSDPSDVVLDPYMGGGTTIVEALARGRQAIGCDLNSLSVFVTKVKTTTLSHRDTFELTEWASAIVPTLNYHDCPEQLTDVICEARTRNLALPRARPIKKLIALALITIDELSSDRAQDFARCAVLNASQWALNGKRTNATANEFRSRIADTTLEMIEGTWSLAASLHKDSTPPLLLHGSSERLCKQERFANGDKVDLVVTSPPYPGVHVLYHRWQVDGRKESPAPYWIANCLDGQGASYYTFGGRAQEGHDNYFNASLRTLESTREVMRDGAPFVQMIAFSEPATQLPRYLRNMERAGFEELRPNSKAFRRIWRGVPGRSWHAELQGDTSSSREVVLIHGAN
jgi:DNA modification methylase